jgi:streptogrisin B
VRRPSALTALLAVLATLAAVLLAAPAASAEPIAVRGGDTLYRGDGARCTLAFNTRRDGGHYGIIAGHCGGAGTTWYVDAARTVPLGTTVVSSFPGDDYGVVHYTNTALSHPGEVGAGGATWDITGAAAPRIGQSVCHVGGVGGLRCGSVTAVNVTVNHGGGSVLYGLLRSNACHEPGDTGGPAFSGTTALGVIVFGSGGCASGGVTLYQPVTEVLQAHGLSLY